MHGPEKVEKQGRNENTKRLSCYRKIPVKKDWKLDYFCCLAMKHIYMNSSLPGFPFHDYYV